MFDSDVIFSAGSDGVNEISPAFRIETGTVTITLSAYSTNGSVLPGDKIESPLMITFDPE
jgi:hypothetical protein